MDPGQTMQDLTTPIGISTSHAATPVIFDLQSIIAKTNPISERIHRQRCLDAVLLVADAWQILVRKRKMRIASAVDKMADDLFLSSWNAVAAEVFMLRRPEKRRRDLISDGDAASSSQTLAVVDDDGYGPGDSATQQAERYLAAAWDVLAGLPGGGGRDADEIKHLGFEQFGEESFRDAMTAAKGKGTGDAFEFFEHRCKNGPDSYK